MNNSLKRIMAAALMLCMLLSLCACGASEKTPASEAEKEESGGEEFIYVADYTSIRKDSDDRSLPELMCEDGFYLSGSEKIGEKPHEGKTAEYEGQFDINVPTLAFCDFDGNKTELSDYAPSSLENGNEGKRDYDETKSIYAMTMDNKGVLCLVERCFCSWSEAPDSVKENDAQYQDYYRSSDIYYLHRVDAKTGAELSCVLLELDENAPIYSNKFLFDSSNNLLIPSDSTLYAFAEDGTLEYSISYDGYIYTLVKAADGGIGMTCLNTTSYEMELLFLDGDTGRFLPERYSLPNEASECLDGGGDYDIYYSSGVYLYGYSCAEERADKLLNWISCGISYSEVRLLNVQRDGTITGFTGSKDESTGKISLDYMRLTKQPYDSVEHKETLSMAVVYMNENTQKAVIEFNRKSDKYCIEVNDYSEYNKDGDYNAGYTKLMTEIMAGNVPDLLDVAQSGLPYRRLASKGLLEDIKPYIEADKELKLENYFDNVFNILEIDGSMYGACAGFAIVTAAGATSIVGDEPGWTYDELNEALDKMPEGCQVFDYGYGKDEVLSMCSMLELDNFVDWSSGKCSFDSPEFIKLLEFAKGNDSKEDYAQYDNSTDNTDTRIAEGRQLLTVTTFVAPDFIYTDLDRSFGGQATLIGFPTSEGIGSMMYMLDCFAMSSSCKNKEAAWEFLRMMLLEDYQQDGYYLATNKKVFEQKLAKSMEIEYERDANGNYLLDENGERKPILKGSFTDGNQMYEIYATTERQAEQLREAVANTHKLLNEDESILKIITEGAAPYFEGQKSAEECARLIQSKANIYINEQR